MDAKKVLKILKKMDYEVDHQTGSHIIMRKQSKPHTRVTIPNHKPIAKGTLKAIMRHVGLSNEDLWSRMK